jgi:hypothetical protein
MVGVAVATVVVAEIVAAAIAVVIAVAVVAVVVFAAIATVVVVTAVGIVVATVVVAAATIAVVTIVTVMAIVVITAVAMAVVTVAAIVVIAVMIMVVMAMTVMPIVTAVVVAVIAVMSVVTVAIVAAVMAVTMVAIMVVVVVAMMGGRGRRRVIIIATVIGRRGVGRGARIVRVQLIGVFVVARVTFVTVGVAAIGARRGFDLAQDGSDLVVVQQCRVAGAHLDQDGGQVTAASLHRFDQDILAVGKGLGRAHVLEQIWVLRGEIVANLHVGRQGCHADATERGRQY